LIEQDRGATGEWFTEKMKVLPEARSTVLEPISRSDHAQSKAVPERQKTMPGIEHDGRKGPSGDGQRKVTPQKQRTLPGFEDDGWRGSNLGGNADVSGFGDKVGPTKDAVKPGKLDRGKFGAFGKDATKPGGILHD
jgi:hypothetical protein